MEGRRNGIAFVVSVYVCIGIISVTSSYKRTVLVPDNHKSFFLSGLENSQPFHDNKSAHNIISKLKASRYTANVTKVRKNIITHVAFLKVHKTGSTTLQHLFYRFALRHKLNILLPERGNYLGKSLVIPLKPGEHYDILACHSVYKKGWIDGLLPTDSVKIGIIREPVERMISAAYFFRDVYSIKYLKMIPRLNFIHNLVNFPEKYDVHFFSHPRNTMGRDFGFQSGIQRTNKSLIKKYLDYLNEQFSLVLIMEKINESLVMMKRLLNWSFIDILYFEMNSHKYLRTVLNATETAKLRNTSFLDFEIYDYFSAVFEMKLKQIGYDFYDEVTFYKTVLEQVRGFCLNKFKAEETRFQIPKSKWDGTFQVKMSDCELMQTDWKLFFSKVRSKYLLSAEMPIPWKGK
ncbi:galactosylceramide sulfotransferase-like [Mercenaria mercenaria]|uniref:galactosylceramide sulfotransferase-like n=1 Tax=Mercenaria mercenaria TaxID=6596 RepID=UPI00234F771F|nr:galactosylceramide sulfotransferase-like [Mercenaria mercenaria]